MRLDQNALSTVLGPPEAALGRYGPIGESWTLVGLVSVIGMLGTRCELPSKKAG